MEIFHDVEGIDPEIEKKPEERITVRETEPKIEAKAEVKETAEAKEAEE